MGMNYGKVSPKFWTGATGRQLRGDRDAQIVAIYLMTSPHANGIGVYHCPSMYIAHETGCSIDGVSKALLRLSEIDFCTVDQTTETIWVHEMAAFQIGTELKPGDKRATMVQRFFDAIPNPYMQRAFYDRNAEAYRLAPSPKMAPDARPSEGASKDLIRGIEGASTNNTNNSYSNNNNTSTITPSPLAPDLVGGDVLAKLPAKREQGAVTSLSKSTNIDFEDWWKLYPLKKSKAGALRSFERIIKAGTATIEELRAGAMRYAAERSDQDPKYTKHPTTWLNLGCWTDEGTARIGAFSSPNGGGSSPRSGAVSRLLNKIHSDSGKQEAS